MTSSAPLQASTRRTRATSPSSSSSSSSAAPVSAAPPGALKPEALDMKAPPILPPHQQHRAVLPVNNPSFDIACFLKNTGPPSWHGASPTELEDEVMGRRKSRHKSLLRSLRVGGRKGLVARGEDVEWLV